MNPVPEQHVYPRCMYTYGKIISDQRAFSAALRCLHNTIQPPTVMRRHVINGVNININRLFLLVAQKGGFNAVRQQGGLAGWTPVAEAMLPANMVNDENARRLRRVYIESNLVHLENVYLHQARGYRIMAPAEYNEEFPGIQALGVGEGPGPAYP